jgi:hypothetical protein
MQMEEFPNITSIMWYKTPGSRPLYGLWNSYQITVPGVALLRQNEPPMYFPLQILGLELHLP